MRGSEACAADLPRHARQDTKFGNLKNTMNKNRMVIRLFTRVRSVNTRNFVYTTQSQNYTSQNL